MSPALALDSSIFRFYVVLALILLGGAGLTLALLRWGLQKNVAHAWQSFRGWLIMVPLVLGAVFLGRIAAILFFTFLAIGAFKEFARATGLYNDWPMSGVVSLAIAMVGLVALVPDPFDGRQGWYGMFMAMPVYVIALILMVPILRNRTQGQLQLLALSIVGFVYFG